ncbi:MAG: hypothetical protein PHW42_05375 [Patescibacteria group bacterium]|nr:hypothetical protein [Patescibacteria group bacterium]MDD4695843.1 hypothetical protein [Patescibacteria group bacterium]
MKTIILSLIIMLTILSLGCDKTTKPEHNDQKLIIMNTQIYYLDDWFSREELVDVITTRMQILATKGVNCITLYKGGYIFNDHIYEEFAGRNLNNDGVAGWGNLTDEQLITLSTIAHGLGMKVQLALDLFPIVYDASGWCIYLGHGVREGSKCDFIPNYIDVFFNEYAQYTKDCAELAQTMGAELFNFGQELEMISTPQYSQYWDNIITGINSKYSGSITYYSKNGHYGGTDEFDTMCSQLKSRVDYLGCTMYIQGLSNLNNPSISLIRQGVVPSFQKWEQRSTEYGKKVIIGETACGSYNGALGNGFLGQMYNENYLNGAVLNEEIQANYFQACLENLQTKSSIYGLAWDKAYYQRWNPVVNEKGPSPFSNESIPKSMLDRIKNPVQ